MLPKYRITVQREIEVDCNDEGIAIGAALDVAEWGREQIMSAHYDAKEVGDVAIAGVVCTDPYLRLPKGCWIVGGVRITHSGRVDLTNDHDLYAEVYPNAQNKGKTWGLRLVYPGCLVGGQFKGAEFTLLDALFAAHAHCAKETVTKEALRPIAFAILKRKPAKEPPHPRVCAWGW